MCLMIIDIDELVFVLDILGIDYYFDLYSGKVLLIFVEVFDFELDVLLENELECLLLIDLLSIIQLLGLMQDFFCEVEELYVYVMFVNVLQSCKLFKVFKYFLMEYLELLQDWYCYQNECLCEWVLDWLEDNDIQLVVWQSLMLFLLLLGKLFVQCGIRGFGGGRFGFVGFVDC